MHRSSRFTQTLAGQFARSIEMVRSPHLFPLRNSSLGSFQLGDNASETLCERIMNVTSHAIALGQQIRLPILRGETSQLQCKHCLMSESSRQFDLLAQESPLLAEADNNQPRDTSGDQHRHEEN